MKTQTEKQPEQTYSQRISAIRKEFNCSKEEAKRINHQQNLGKVRSFAKKIKPKLEAIGFYDTKPVEISKSSVSKTGKLETDCILNSPSKSDYTPSKMKLDSVVLGILKKSPKLKPAAIRSLLPDSYIVTYDDVFYSVQRVKLAK